MTLQRAAEIGPAVAAAWRDLASALSDPDPFADPDYLLTAALNAGRASDILFAFAYGATRSGRPVLRGVLPLTLPHPVWGGTAVRLWQPALATRPVEPAIEPGAEAGTIRAVLRHLIAIRPQTILRLGRIGAGSALIPALAADPALRVAVYRRSVPMSGSSAATVAATGVDRADATVTETITRRAAMRDAVERFLLVDAERAACPLIAEPGAASIVRVVTRLFARRAAVHVELDRRGDAIVGGAIRLGAGPEPVPWRTVGQCAEPCVDGRADLVIALDASSAAAPRMRPSLVAP